MCLWSCSKFNGLREQARCHHIRLGMFQIAEMPLQWGKEGWPSSWASQPSPCTRSSPVSPPMPSKNVKPPRTTAETRMGKNQSHQYQYFSYKRNKNQCLSINPACLVYGWHHAYSMILVLAFAFSAFHFIHSFVCSICMPPFFLRGRSR